MRSLILFLALSAALAAQPRRIVSTAPGITETLFALGLGDRVVGVSQYCHYPPEASKRPQIGSYLRPNVEAIMGLRPDLVIVQSLPDSVLPRLQQMKLNTLSVDHGKLEHTLTSIQTIGDRCGVPDRARALVANIRARLDAVRQRTSRAPRRSLIFVVGRTPGRLEGMVVVGRGSYLNELIAIAGGNNPLSSSPLDYLRLSLESLIGINPDVLVDMGDMADTVGVSEAHKREVVAMWKGVATLKAPKRGGVYAVASDVFVVPGPRMVEAAEMFARMLHPEVFK
jgi:iron complex transport system substrate-binding protein